MDRSQKIVEIEGPTEYDDDTWRWSAWNEEGLCVSVRIPGRMIVELAEAALRNKGRRARRGLAIAVCESPKLSSESV